MNNLDKELLSSHDKSEDDFIREIAEEEGMTFEEVKESVEKFKAMIHKDKIVDSKNAKAKKKARRKMAKQSRKKNR